MKIIIGGYYAISCELSVCLFWIFFSLISLEFIHSFHHKLIRWVECNGKKFKKKHHFKMNWLAINIKFVSVKSSIWMKIQFTVVSFGPDWIMFDECNIHIQFIRININSERKNCYTILMKQHNDDWFNIQFSHLSKKTYHQKKNWS